MKRKAGFTLIEMIFVIVILGIMGSLGSEIILNIYRNYVIQKGVSKLEVSLKSTVEQISNHLDRAIVPSIAVYDSGNTRYESIDYINRSGEGNFTANTDNRLVWIGKDIENMQGIWNGGKVYQNYSGLADLSQSSGVNIVVSDSNLTNDDSTSNIDSIVNGIMGFNAVGNSALYFVYANSIGTTESRFWWNRNSPVSPISLYEISGFSGDTIQLSTQPDEIGDIFYLAYTAFGIHFNTVDDNNKKLEFIWDFQPWKDEDFQDGKRQLLLENITDFQIWSESGGSVIRLYICATDSDIQGALGNDSWEYCKESVIVR